MAVFKGQRDWKRFWLLHEEVAKWKWADAVHGVDRIGYHLLSTPLYLSPYMERELLLDVIEIVARALGLTHQVVWERHILLFRSRVSKPSTFVH